MADPPPPKKKIKNKNTVNVRSTTEYTSAIRVVFSIRRASSDVDRFRVVAFASAAAESRRVRLNPAVAAVETTGPLVRSRRARSSLTASARTVAGCGFFFFFFFRIVIDRTDEDAGKADATEKKTDTAAARGCRKRQTLSPGRDSWISPADSRPKHVVGDVVVSRVGRLCGSVGQNCI